MSFRTSRLYYKVIFGISPNSYTTSLSNLPYSGPGPVTDVVSFLRVTNRMIKSPVPLPLWLSVRTFTNWKVYLDAPLKWLDPVDVTVSLSQNHTKTFCSGFSHEDQTVPETKGRPLGVQGYTRHFGVSWRLHWPKDFIRTTVMFLQSFMPVELYLVTIASTSCRPWLCFGFSRLSWVVSSHLWSHHVVH